MNLWQWLLIILQVASLIGGIVGGVGGFVVFLLKNSFVTHRELTERFAAHDKVHDNLDLRLNQGDKHLTRLDGETDKALTHRDLDPIRQDLTQLKNAVAAIEGSSDERSRRVEHIERSVDRILDFHMNGGGK